ncbi:methyltransferase domain-containing protein [Polymorphospora sp. NPDC050346]|uniref:class I SAM-dependent methyltransferase n=1 Tax=Polymorphospora sp. NPDC050346 TaxID=3155780 RepID=UPI00341083F3
MADPGSVANFNRIADRYDRHPGQFGCRRADDDVLDALDGVSPRTVLDIGCGTGRLLHRVALRWPAAHLTGIDPASEMIRVARTKLPEATLLTGTAEQLPVGDGTVDLVLSTTSFGHWSDQPAGLREVARALAPQGRFVLAEHTPPPAWSRRLLRVFGELPAHHDQPTTRRLVEAAGLRVVRAGRVRGGLLLVVAVPA